MQIDLYYVGTKPIVPKLWGIAWDSKKTFKISVVNKFNNFIIKFHFRFSQKLMTILINV